MPPSKVRADPAMPENITSNKIHDPICCCCRIELGPQPKLRTPWSILGEQHLGSRSALPSRLLCRQPNLSLVGNKGVPHLMTRYSYLASLPRRMGQITFWLLADQQESSCVCIHCRGERRHPGRIYRSSSPTWPICHRCYCILSSFGLSMRTIQAIRCTGWSFTTSAGCYASLFWILQ